MKWTNIYLKEQTEYIQNQINEHRDTVDDKQSMIAWQTVNEVNRRKSIARAKQKADNQEERIHLRKQHFENLLRKLLKVTDEPITKMISNQWDIKLGQFTQEELDSAGLDEIPPEVWKTREFDDILLHFCNAVYNQNTIDKGCILPFHQKGDFGIAKNYQVITLTSIAAKIYNALLHNHIQSKIENILRKNQNGFQRNQSTISQILTIHQILEGVHAKNLEATQLFINSIHRGKIEQILLTYNLPKKTVPAIMMLYKNTKIKVCSPDEDTDYLLRHCSRCAVRRYISPHTCLLFV